ncbi:hypothetical protein SteCoe_3925 [Stentor coeruleus]|uniref:Uncharacterized protein n=1 Tax=Stentor coeruleus TaxID=5963 RepID=A0A1R2CVT1_9CILI|nr:hypothetical protein SteCoe_3925 [Stentor coeruleus]
MGCKQCKPCEKNLSFKQRSFSQLKEAIDGNSSKKFQSTIALIKHNFKDISIIFDAPDINHKHLKLNSLCYSLIQGKHEAFSSLLNEGASINKMNDLFESQNLRALDIVCAKGYLEILKILLPIYLESKSHNENMQSTVHFPDFEPEKSFPIQIATKSGMIQIISYIRSFFSGRENIPVEFDINAINPRTGENCGLLACRYGNQLLLDFFYRTCNVDLRMLNKDNENAVIICLQGFKKRRIYSYFNCVKYLIDVVKIDITYRYQFMINLAECPDTIRLLTSKLAEEGINVDKTETANSPFRNFHENSQFSSELGLPFSCNARSTFGSAKDYLL